jgi:peptide/nickel transport system permease protein
MTRFVIQRILLSFLIIWGVLTLTFIIIHLAPGDPAAMYVDPEIPPDVVENIRKQMGLNESISDQYLKWMRECLTGNLGISFSYKKPVSRLILETIPNTLQLTLLVFALQLFFGIIIGVFTAVRRNSVFDLSINSILIFLYSFPGFWLALMFILIFSYTLGWLPSSQMTTWGISGNFMVLLLDRIKHLILPVFVLTIHYTAYTARFIRGSFGEVLDQDYMRTAIAYGLKPAQIYFKYALKNSLLPVVTLLGIYLPFLWGGAVVIEYIFAWPGMGRLTVEAIFAHDYPLILGSTIIAALTVVVGNFLSDLLYALVDPRIKTTGA